MRPTPLNIEEWEKLLNINSNKYAAKIMPFGANNKREDEVKIMQALAKAYRAGWRARQALVPPDLRGIVNHG